MQKPVLIFVFFFILSKTYSQQDTQLVRRLNDVLKYTQDQNLDKVLDYTYPKIFTIVGRNDLKEAMKGVYETDEFINTLDSIMIDTIYPIFKISDAQYVKIRHTMLMKMHFKEPIDTTDMESNNSMIKLMEKEFGEGKVRFDKMRSTIMVSMMPYLVGIKDKLAKEWCFVNLDEDNAMVKMILDKQVLDKLKEFK